jgi:hypothetical protein
MHRAGKVFMVFLESRAGQIVAGALSCFVVACGAYVWVVYHGFLAWLTVVLVTALVFLFLCWVGVHIVRQASAPRVVYDKGERIARMIDGQLVAQPLYPANLSSLSTRYDSRANAPQLAASTVEADEAPQFPSAVLYRNIAPLIPSGQLLLGVRAGGTLRVETLQERKSVLILGKSGSGKTMTLARYVAESRAGLIVCDPHAHKEDSLARKIAPLAPNLWPGTTIAQERPAILRNISVARALLQGRKDGGRYSNPLVIAVEEFVALYYDEEIKVALQALTREMTAEGRGYDVYLYAGAQRMMGNLFAELRSLFAGYILHRVEYADAYTLLHDSKLAKQAMQQKPGITIAIDSNGEQEQIQQTLFTSVDALEIANTAPAMLNPARAFSFPVEEAKTPIIPMISGKEKEKKEILALHAQGLPAYAIARQLHKSSAYAEEIKRIIAEETSDA